MPNGSETFRTCVDASLCLGCRPDVMRSFLQALMLWAFVCAFPVDGADAVIPASGEIEKIRSKAEAGDKDSQSRLGAMYDTGRGVHRDYGEAAKWYRKAADQGDADAQWHLGQLYQYGLGVTQDVTEGMKWYRKAAA